MAEQTRVLYVLTADPDYVFWTSTPRRISTPGRAPRPSGIGTKLNPSP